LSKFAVLSVASFGFYLLYWFYQQWKHERARTGEELWPFVRAFFSVIFAYSLFTRVRDYGEFARVTPLRGAGILALAYFTFSMLWNLPAPYFFVGTIAAIIPLPAQAAINRINHAVAPGADPNRRYSAWNGALIMVGVLVYGLVIAGVFITPDVTTEPTVVVASDQQSQLTVPAGWVVDADLHDEAEIEVADLKHGAFLLVLTEAKSDYADDLDYRDHSRLTLESILEDSDDGEPIAGPTDLTINGRRAVQYEFVVTSDRLRIAYLHTTIDGTESFYQIVAWSVRSAFDANREALQEIIRSFAETGKGSPVRVRSSALPWEKMGDDGRNARWRYTSRDPACGGSDRDRPHALYPCQTPPRPRPL